MYDTLMIHYSSSNLHVQFADGLIVMTSTILYPLYQLLETEAGHQESRHFTSQVSPPTPSYNLFNAKKLATNISLEPELRLELGIGVVSVLQFKQS